jgi:hypothetical protein
MEAGMTLADILSDLYGSLGYASSPDSGVTSRLTRFVNDGYKTLIRLPGFKQVRFKTINLTSVLNQKLYGITPAAVQILKISDQTNNQSLLEMSLDTFRRVDPQELVTGVPTHYVRMGLRPVYQEPATSGVWVASASASDTAITVRLVGTTVTGETAVQTATLNGTTRVQVGALTTFTGISEWNINTAAVGAVTLYDAAVSGNALSTIQVGKTSVQYLVIRLWPTVQDAYSYVIDIETPLPELTNAVDVPVIPEDWHTMLVEYGRMLEYEYRGDERWPIAKGMFDQNLKGLKVRLWNSPDFLPVAGVIPNVPNNLGPWYPSGRW